MPLLLIVAGNLLADEKVRRAADSLTFGTAARTVAVRFSALGARFSKLPVRIAVEVADDNLSYTMTARETQQLTTIVVPRDARSITVSADRHHGRELKLAEHRPGTTWDVALERKPAFTGRVVDAAGLPVADAVIVTPEQKTVAATGPSGVIDTDWEEAPPPFVTIDAPAFASRRATVTRDGADLSIGLVELLRGGTIALRIESEEPRENLDVTVKRKRDDRPGSYAVRRVKAAAGVTSIDAIDPGEYIVEVAGSEPLQRLAADVTVRNGETTAATVEIRPIRLEIRARLGSAPVVQAPVRVTSAEFEWKAELATDDDGAARGELWQDGRYHCAVQTPAKGVYSEWKAIPAKEEFVWDIALPERTVRARVVDANTRKPVSAATVWLQTRRPGRSTQAKGATDERGEYSFGVVDAGAQSVTATADGYLPSSSVHFRLEETDSEREAIVELLPGREVQVAVRYGNGAPAALVTAVAVVDQQIHDRAQTDHNGRATLTVPPSGSCLVVATTATGSFATLRLRPDYRSADTLTIVLPPADGSLRLRVQDHAGAPVAGIAFLYRFQGELLPPGLMPPPHPLSLTTSFDGSVVLPAVPTGSYEIWPYRAAAEAQAIIATGGAGVQKAMVTVVPGRHEATFTFAGN